MVSSSRIESIATRFEPYIEELREFFASRGLPFGSPADLQPFFQQLTDPGFHEEMESMVRSILYREDALPRIDLMEIVAVAVGGIGVQDSNEALHTSLRQILTFVNEAVRSRNGSSFDDGPATSDTPDSAANPPESTDLPTAPEQPAHFTLVNDRLSQSLLSLQDHQTTEQGIVAGTPPAEPEPLKSAPAAPPIQPPKHSLISLLRRSYWIPGVIALLVAVAAGLLLKTGTAASHNPPTHQRIASSLPAPALSRNAKPSGYGASLQSHGSEPARSVAPEPARPSPAFPHGATPSPNSPTSITARSEHSFPAEPHTRAARTAASPALGSVPPSGAMLNPREGVFLASSGAMASHLLSAPAPGYPKLASFTHTEGQVIVQVVVGRDGRVEATRVLDGPRLLRAAAEHAIRRWRYRPYLVDGRPTDVATIVTVSFRIR